MKFEEIKATQAQFDAHVKKIDKKPSPFQLGVGALIKYVETCDAGLKELRDAIGVVSHYEWCKEILDRLDKARKELKL